MRDVPNTLSFRHPHFSKFADKSISLLMTPRVARPLCLQFHEYIHTILSTIVRQPFSPVKPFKRLLNVFLSTFQISRYRPITKLFYGRPM